MGTRQITILVTEDEPLLRNLLQKILAEYQLLMAADGKQALEIAEQHQGPIDLLLADVIIPDMSGLELARAITAKRPETKIILTSAFTGHGPMDRSWHFIDKPYRPKLLLDAVQQALQSERRPLARGERDAAGQNCGSDNQRAEN